MFSSLGIKIALIKLFCPHKNLLNAYKCKKKLKINIAIICFKYYLNIRILFE